MSAVLLHGCADSTELHGVVSSHSLHALVGSSLVRVDHALELCILLQVLCIAVVSELHHALHLSVHVGVDLSLCHLVLVDGGRQSVHARVGLLDLSLDGGCEGSNADLEVGLSSLDALLSLLLGSSDVSDSLREVLVVESLLGVKGG